MRKYALKLYDSMQQDIEICMKKQFEEDKEIECCYHICTHYWRQLQYGLSIYQFKDDEDEIDFFKNIKPLFMSDIEYYNLRYHAQLFKPFFGYDELQRFWLRESNRLERFIENNSKFYEYYTNKATGLDHVYFLRRNNVEVDVPEANMSQLERKTSTSHDHLLSDLMALEKYAVYVQKQLEKLNKTVKNGN